MSTLQMERGGPVVTRAPAVETVPDHIPADVSAEHPDAAAVVARRPERPVTVRVVDRGPTRSKAGLVLALAACALVAVLAGGAQEPSPRPVQPTTPPAATTVTTVPADGRCGPGAPMVLRCDPPCSPASFGPPLGFCSPRSPEE